MINLPMDREYYRVASRHVEEAITAFANKRFEVFGAPKWILSSRIKELSRVQGKVERKRKTRPSYSVAHMTDLAGVRAIVESVHSAHALASFMRRKHVFPVLDEDSEEFTETPRADGYRGIHLVLSVEVGLADKKMVPVELQIRTMLQHAWSELSRSEFYKTEADIPPDLLIRMRSLSELLHCADLESDHLRYGRIAEECVTLTRSTLRRRVLEKLRHGCSEEDARRVGSLAIALVELTKQVGHVFVSEGQVQAFALDALKVVAEEIEKKDPSLKPMASRIRERACAVVETVPEEWG